MSYLSKLNNLPVMSEILNRLSGSSHAILIYSDDSILLDCVAKMLILKEGCYDKNGPCFMCAHCKELLDGNQIDVEYYGYEKNISVEDSENIVESSYILPLQLDTKYFVLNNFDRSTIQAQNKLLKSIEEPPRCVKFILLTTNLSAVLPTIKSRCEVYSLPKLPSADLINIFDFKSGDGEKAKVVCEYSCGNLSKLEKAYNDSDFMNIYNLALKMLLYMRNSSYILEYSSQIIKFKQKSSIFFEILEGFYMDMLYIKNGKNDLIQYKNVENQLKVLSQSISEIALVKIINEIQMISQKLMFNANFTGVVDNLLLKILEIKYKC